MSNTFEAHLQGIISNMPVLELSPAHGISPALFEKMARERGYVKLPTGWHIVPEHATERQIVAGSKATSHNDRYRRMVLAAPKLPGV